MPHCPLPPRTLGGCAWARLVARYATGGILAPMPPSPPRSAARPWGSEDFLLATFWTCG